MKAVSPKLSEVLIGDRVRVFLRDGRDYLLPVEDVRPDAQGAPEVMVATAASGRTQLGLDGWIPWDPAGAPGTFALAGANVTAARTFSVTR